MDPLPTHCYIPYEALAVLNFSGKNYAAQKSEIQYTGAATGLFDPGLHCMCILQSLIEALEAKEFNMYKQHVIENVSVFCI